LNILPKELPDPLSNRNPHRLPGIIAYRIQNMGNLLCQLCFSSWQANECRTHIEQSSAFINQVEIITGKKNIEVRPNLTSKGKIISMLLERHKVDFVFCAGDDKTDEDMFKALCQMPENIRTFTCKIGHPSTKTSAKYRFNTSDQMVSLLMRLGLLGSEVNRQIGMTL
jgi:trehalose-phosphatase